MNFHIYTPFYKTCTASEQVPIPAEFLAQTRRFTTPPTSARMPLVISGEDDRVLTGIAHNQYQTSEPSSPT